MISLCVLTALLVAVAGKVISHPGGIEDIYHSSYPKSFGRQQHEMLRRDLYSSKFGYEHNIYDGDAGKVDARVHGEHSHSPPRKDSTSYGAGATSHDDNARASVDYIHQMHEKDYVSATGGGSWKVGDNGKFYVEGQYQH